MILLINVYNNVPTFGWSASELGHPVFSKWPMHDVQNLTCVKDRFELQGRAMDFHVIDHEKFVFMVSNFQIITYF